jgi:hypothetical protein
LHLKEQILCKLHLKEQILKPGKIALQVQGLQAGGFKLCVNWIQLVQPHHREVRALGDDVFDQAAAVQVAFESEF